jgi:hypothetical protein
LPAFDPKSATRQPSGIAQARFKGFEEMGRALQREQPDAYLYPELVAGAVYWVSNTESDFGSGPGVHPFVIVVGHSPGRVDVIACPRTSTGAPRRGAPAVQTPGGLIAGLDKAGVVLVAQWRAFALDAFAEYERLGQLNAAWTQRVVGAYRQWVQGRS